MHTLTKLLATSAALALGTPAQAQHLRLPGFQPPHASGHAAHRGPGDTFNLQALIDSAAPISVSMATPLPTSSAAWLASNVLAELLGQSDDDALRATQEAEPVDVLVLRDLADEFSTVAA